MSGLPNPDTSSVAQQYWDLLNSPYSPLYPYRSPVVINTPVVAIPVSQEPVNSTSKYLPSLNLGYSTPLVGIYENLNADPNLQSRMVKYFYFKTLDKWLYDDLDDALNYLTSKDGKIDILSNLNDYKMSTVEHDSDLIIKKKIEFIEEYFLTKSMVSNILTNLTEESDIQWVNLAKNEYIVKKFIGKYLIKQLKKAISKK